MLGELYLTEGGYKGTNMPFNGITSLSGNIVLTPTSVSSSVGLKWGLFDRNPGNGSEPSRLVATGTIEQYGELEGQGRITFDHQVKVFEGHKLLLGFYNSGSTPSISASERDMSMFLCTLSRIEGSYISYTYDLTPQSGYPETH
jgi:hypothetical protein